MKKVAETRNVKTTLPFGKKGISCLIALMIPAVLSGFMVSCSSEEDMDGAGNNKERGIRITATVAETLDTRSYQEQGVIESGLYYLTYPNFYNNETYSVSDVNFYESGYGVTTTEEGFELKWQDVGTLSYNNELTVFYLDNVPPPSGNHNATTIPFTAEYNPFVAGVFDDEEGTNDLLWGYQHLAPESTEDINIGIHHYMSRVSVIVTVDNSNEYAEEIDFKNGSVKITNVVHEGVSFNRLNGMISLGDDPQYKELYLTTNGDWESVTEDSNTRGISYFKSKNFVLPPQQLLTDDRRPRLVLEVPQKDGSKMTYSGVLPRVMIVDGSPVNLAFDVEKNLTLKVKLSQDLLYIESIYAYVQDWVDKGTHLVVGNQGGIYSTDDLKSMIDLYNASDEDGLIRYGYKLDGEWVFDIFTDLVVDASEFAGTMTDRGDFSFDLTIHTLTIVGKDGKEQKFEASQKEEAAAALKALVTAVDP